MAINPMVKVYVRGMAAKEYASISVHITSELAIYLISLNTQVLSKANTLRENTETKTRLEPDTTYLYGIYAAN
jgi:hypothetical protein